LEAAVRTLLIEDNALLATSVERILTSAHIICDTIDTGEEGAEVGRIYDYDIILLDLTLPDISGFDVLRQLRRSAVKTPIVIISGCADTAGKIKALELGADDYLTKPFEPRELIARIQAIVRRSRGHSDPVIRTGRLAVDLTARVAKVDDRPLPLPPKEYAILELLSLHKGRTLDKTTFLDHLYGGVDEPDLKIIDVFICKLRKRLKTATGGEQYLLTDWGHGHMLCDLPPKPAADGATVAA
jgi:two-component system cell cycle response regulator CtrA